MSIKIVVRPVNLCAPSTEHGVRDVYLISDTKHSRGAVLWHPNCPLHVARRMALWAKLVAYIPVEVDPPGSLEDGWKWPDEPAPEVVPTKSVFDME